MEGVGTCQEILMVNCEAYLYISSRRERRIAGAGSQTVRGGIQENQWSKDAKLVGGSVQWWGLGEAFFLLLYFRCEVGSS